MTQDQIHQANLKSIREKFKKELFGDGKEDFLNQILALTIAEVGESSAEAQRAVLETLMNRADAYGRSLETEYGGGYYAPVNSNSIQTQISKINNNGSLKEKILTRLNEVLAGSNESNLAMNNGSAGVAATATDLGDVRKVINYGSGDETFYNKTKMAGASKYGEGVRLKEMQWLNQFGLEPPAFPSSRPESDTFTGFTDYGTNFDSPSYAGAPRFPDQSTGSSNSLGFGPNITNIGMQSILQLAPDLAAEAIQSRIPNAPGLSSLGSEIVSSLSSGQEVSSIMDSIRKLTSATSTQDRANVLLEILQENQQFIQQQMNRRGMSIPTSLISDYLPMMDDFELMDSKNRALMLVDMARRIDPQMVPENVGSSLDEGQKAFIQGLLKPGLDVNALTVEQFLDKDSYVSEAEGRVTTAGMIGNLFGADVDNEMLRAIQENIQGDPTKLLEQVILQSASEKLPNVIGPDYQQPATATEEVENKGLLSFLPGSKTQEKEFTIAGQNTLEEAGGFRPEQFELKLYDPDLKKLAESIPVILKEDIDQILETPIARQYLDQRVSLETGELTYKNVLDAVLTEDERGMVRFVSDVGEMVTGFESRDIQTIIRGTNDEQRQKELRASVGGKVLDDYITSNPTLKSIIDFFSSNKELMILLGSTAGISALSGLIGGGMFGGALAGAGGVAATRFIFGEEGFSDLMSTLNSAATPAFDFIQNIFDESGISDIPILGDMLGGVLGLGRDNPVAALSALTGNFGGAAGILAGTAGVNLFDGKTSFNAMMESLSDSVPAGANQIVKDLAIAFGRPPSNDYTEVMGNNTSGSNPNGSPGMTGLFHPDDKVFTSDNPGNMSSAAAGL